MTGDEMILYLAATARMCQVRDVRGGAYVPVGSIHILGIRGGRVVRTEAVDARDVEWDRLLPDDFIEEVAGG